MEKKELLAKLVDQGFSVTDAEEGTYCFYCGSQVTFGFTHNSCKHDKDCLWLVILAEVQTS